MATVSLFRLQFPEFNSVSDPSIAMAIGLARLEMSTLVWGLEGVVGQPMTKFDSGCNYLAAHKLAMTAMGQNSKAVFKDRFGYDRTTYGSEFKLMQRGVTGGFRVA
jgi:hypothetical protein